MNSSHRLGGQVVAAKVNAPGFSTAGYTDVLTSDHVVNGQVKQSGNFAFVRVYESGHEVPFYQPVLALEMFARAIQGKDIATGKQSVCGGWGSGYKTVGPAESTYREGNSTMVFESLPPDATYNTTMHRPNPVSNNTSTSGGSTNISTSKPEQLEYVMRRPQLVQSDKRALPAYLARRSGRQFKPSFRKMK